MDAEDMQRLRTALHRAEVEEGIVHNERAVPATNRGHKLEAPTDTVLTIDADVIADDIDYEAPTNPGDLDVDVGRILQPISDPAEVSSHDVLRRIFTSPFLKRLSTELLDTLVDERDVMAQIVKLMDTMLGDDDLEIMPQIMARVDEQPPYPTPEPGKPLPPVETDPSWFFKLPEVSVDRNQGLSEQEAQELREKLQVAQQRMVEYVRRIADVRLDLLRAHRLRRTVLNWCREMNGEDYVRADLDLENNFDNDGLGDQPAKDVYQG